MYDNNIYVQVKCTFSVFPDPLNDTKVPRSHVLDGGGAAEKAAAVKQKQHTDKENPAAQRKENAARKLALAAKKKAQQRTSTRKSACAPKLRKPGTCCLMCAGDILVLSHAVQYTICEGWVDKECAVGYPNMRGIQHINWF